MSSSQPSSNPINVGNADFAQTFKEITRGEQTAAALEKQLSAMEQKIDELLAQAEQDQKELDEKNATVKARDNEAKSA